MMGCMVPVLIVLALSCAGTGSALQFFGFGRATTASTAGIAPNLNARNTVAASILAISTAFYGPAALNPSHEFVASAKTTASDLFQQARNVSAYVIDGRREA
jgi:hypothetical protein